MIRSARWFWSHMNSPITFKPLAIRTIILIALVLIVGFISWREYEARKSRGRIEALVVKHQEETEAALHNTTMSWARFEESEARAEIQIKYMEKLNAQMDGILKSQEALLKRLESSSSSAPRPAPVAPAPKRGKLSPSRKRLRQCTKRVQVLQKYGNTEVVRDVLVLVPC